MVPGQNGGNWAYVNLFLAHGLTAAVTVYLAVRGGAWMDQRLGTSPWLLLVAVVLVIAANLHLLIKDVLAEAERQERASRGRGRGAPGQTRKADGREEVEE